MKVIIFLLCFSIIGLASSKQYTVCLENSVSTSDSMECNQEEFKIQDKLLNNNYKKLMAKLDKEQKIELQDVQRKWIAYKDAKCNSSLGLSGGTMDNLTIGSCFIRMTEDRNKDLEYLLFDN